jgi:hypothetical protein
VDNASRIVRAAVSEAHPIVSLIVKGYCTRDGVWLSQNLLLSRQSRLKVVRDQGLMMQTACSVCCRRHSRHRQHLSMRWVYTSMPSTHQLNSTQLNTSTHQHINPNGTTLAASAAPAGHGHGPIKAVLTPTRLTTSPWRMRRGKRHGPARHGTGAAAASVGKRIS